jgi:hypothetical protein
MDKTERIYKQDQKFILSSKRIKEVEKGLKE